ncbi:hypothetical protein [Aquabacterium sp.]|uniref:hypothetical protein n=1 Tax=Aquabacterium sp. TaxID=1872578 RepID=UPI0035AFA376
MFKFKEDKRFAVDLASKLMREIPPDLTAGQGRTLTVNRVTRLLERAFQSAESYRSESKMGFLRRVLMINAFKWELKNKGYPDDFISIATEGLIVALVRKAKA